MISTDEMLEEIASYDYRCYGGFKCVWLYKNNNGWKVSWRNINAPSVDLLSYSLTPNDACIVALDFIKSNPQYFKKKQ